MNRTSLFKALAFAVLAVFAGAAFAYPDTASSMWQALTPHADVGAVLDQSTLNGWQGIFPLREQQQVQRVASPKFKTLGKHGQATANNLMDWLEEA